MILFQCFFNFVCWSCVYGNIMVNLVYIYCLIASFVNITRFCSCIIVGNGYNMLNDFNGLLLLWIPIRSLWPVKMKLVESEPMVSWKKMRRQERIGMERKERERQWGKIGSISISLFCLIWNLSIFPLLLSHLLSFYFFKPNMWCLLFSSCMFNIIFSICMESMSHLCVCVGICFVFILYLLIRWSFNEHV